MRANSEASKRAHTPGLTAAFLRDTQKGPLSLALILFATFFARRPGEEDLHRKNQKFEQGVLAGCDQDPLVFFHGLGQSPWHEHKGWGGNVRWGVLLP